VITVNIKIYFPVFPISATCPNEENTYHVLG